VEVASAGATVAEIDPGAVATIPIFPQNEFGVGCRCVLRRYLGDLFFLFDIAKSTHERQ
jgi:hypothetical protein